MKDINLAGNAHEETDILGNHFTFNCIGCSITANEIKVPGGFIIKGKNFNLYQDPAIPIEGFLIISCNRHINSMIELSEEEKNELMNLIIESNQALKELKITDEVTIIQEERSQHLHIWIFPNHDWMKEKFGKGASEIRKICTYAKENATEEDIEKILLTVEKIKQYFKDKRK